VEVPENGRATVEFLSLDVPYGRNKGEVRIDTADTLAADDSFYFSVERSDPRHALFVQDRPAAADCSSSRRRSMPPANRPSRSTRPRWIRWPTWRRASTPSWCSAISAPCPPPSRTPARLRARRRQRVDRAGAPLGGPRKVPVTGDAIQEARYAGREGERFQTVAWLDSSHPSILKDDRWEGVKFYQAIRVAPGDARVAAR
jgi:hypothetical protein